MFPLLKTKTQKFDKKGRPLQTMNQTMRIPKQVERIKSTINMTAKIEKEGTENVTSDSQQAVAKACMKVGGAMATWSTKVNNTATTIYDTHSQSVIKTAIDECRKVVIEARDSLDAFEE